MPNSPSFTSSSRSLERGLRIISCFQPGVGGLKNSEIARLTGLPRTTVTRLTSTMVLCGFLEYEASHKAYFLSSTVLNLGLAKQVDLEVPGEVRAMIRTYAQRSHTNVSLSIPDGPEMVFLMYEQYDHVQRKREIQLGSRVAIATSIVGAAYLNSLDKAHLNDYKKNLKKKYNEEWPVINDKLSELISQIRMEGICQITDSNEIMSIFTRLTLGRNPHYCLTVSQRKFAPSEQHQQEIMILEFLKFFRVIMVNSQLASQQQ